MSTLRILNRRGDTTIAWSPNKLVAGDAEALASVQEAERIFAEARAKGATAFQVIGDDTKRVDELDPTVEAEVVIVPRIAGG